MLKITKLENGIKISNGIKSVIITKNDRWITVKPHGDEEKGRHLLLEGDETPKEAMKRQWGVDVDKKKKVDMLKTSKYKEKTLQQQKEIAELKEKEDKAYNEWLEEEKKLRDFARSKGLGLYDAQKQYPDKEKYEDLRKKRDEIKEKRMALQAKTVDDLSKNIKEELNNYSSKTDSLVKELDKIEDKTKITNEKYSQLQKERDDIYKQLDSGKIERTEALSLFAQNTLKIHEINEEKKKALEEQIKENTKILNKKNTNFKLKSKTTSMGEMSTKLKNTLDGFIGDDVVPEKSVVNVKKLRSGGRAFAKDDSINITVEDGLDVAIHEYSHFIEHENPRVLANSLAFAKMRTEGEKTQSLATITKNRSYKGEYAKKDKFFDAYCGKIYSLDKESYDNANASEILSMGMERLFKEPKKFAQEDREYFNFVIASIKGDI